MTGLGKILIGVGVLLVLVGIAVTLANKTGLPLGRLPGDIIYRGKNTTFYFPLVTCILLSVVLSLVMWLIQRFSR